MKVGAVVLGAVAAGLGVHHAWADAKMFDPSDIGDFDKRQFIESSQAQTLGKDLDAVLGYIAEAAPDGSLTITSCRKIIGTDDVLPTPDLGQPIFSDVIDASWGFKALLAFLNIDVSGNKKVEITATDIAEATLPQANIPRSLSSPIPDCAFAPNASLYYIQKATLSLINKVTYVRGEGGGGFLSILEINGTEYSRTDESNMYTVSVYATPIYRLTRTALTVVKTHHQLVGLSGTFKALGVYSTKNPDPVHSTVLSPATLSTTLMATFTSRCEGEFKDDPAHCLSPAVTDGHSNTF
jgi:hypothetical protein